MPFKSMKQERWAHTDAGKKKMGKKVVNEFDSASKDMKLPEAAPMPKPKQRFTQTMKGVGPI